MSQLNQLPAGSAAGDSVLQKIQRTIIGNAYLIPGVTNDLMIFASPKVAGIQINGTYPLPDPTQWYPAP